MVKGGAALHHLHVRKRIHLHKEPYPSKNPFVRFVDKAIYFAGLVAFIISLPQLLEIWIGKDAAGVSLLTWSSYLFLEILWISYGVIHKLKPLILAYTLVFIIDFFIVLGVIIYG